MFEYVHECMYLYACMHVRMYMTYKHEHMQKPLAHTHTHAHIDTHEHTHESTYSHICTRTRTQTYTSTNKQTYTDINTNTHTCISIDVCTNQQQPIVLEVYVISNHQATVEDNQRCHRYLPWVIHTASCAQNGQIIHHVGFLWKFAEGVVIVFFFKTNNCLEHCAKSWLPVLKIASCMPLSNAVNLRVLHTCEMAAAMSTSSVITTCVHAHGGEKSH
jgi:hypothetical protein